MKKKILELKRVIKIVKWVLKHPKESMLAVERVSIDGQKADIIRETAKIMVDKIRYYGKN